MKVYIGPYPYRFTTRRFEDAWLAWRYGDKRHTMPKREHDKYDHIAEKLADVGQSILNATVNKIIDRKERKIKVHVDNYDVWSADHTLAHIILPVLKRLKEVQQSGPSVDMEDVPEHLRATKHDPYEVDDLYFARWDYVLDAMIFSFEKITDPHWEDEFHSGEIDLRFVPVDKEGNEIEKDDAVLFQMATGPNNTHEVDDVGIKLVNDQIQFGLNMFGKYYRHLWD